MYDMSKINGIKQKNTASRLTQLISTAMFVAATHCTLATCTRNLYCCNPHAKARENSCIIIFCSSDWNYKHVLLDVPVDPIPFQM